MVACCSVGLGVCTPRSSHLDDPRPPSARRLAISPRRAGTCWTRCLWMDRNCKALPRRATQGETKIRARAGGGRGLAFWGNCKHDVGILQLYSKTQLHKILPRQTLESEIHLHEPVRHVWCDRQLESLPPHLHLPCGFRRAMLRGSHTASLCHGVPCGSNLSLPGAASIALCMHGAMPTRWRLRSAPIRLLLQLFLRSRPFRRASE